MRLPQSAALASLAFLLVSQPVSAATMGATSRASLQIIVSVAPRIQISDAAQVDSSATRTLCVQSNTPGQAYKITAIDALGNNLGTVPMPAASLCQGDGALDASNFLKSAGAELSATSSSGQLTLLIAPQ